VGILSVRLATDTHSQHETCIAGAGRSSAWSRNLAASDDELKDWRAQAARDRERQSGVRIGGGHEKRETLKTSNIPANSIDRLVNAVVRGSSAAVVPLLLRSSIARCGARAATPVLAASSCDTRRPFARPAGRSYRGTVVADFRISCCGTRRNDDNDDNDKVLTRNVEVISATTRRRLSGVERREERWRAYS